MKYNFKKIFILVVVILCAILFSSLFSTSNTQNTNLSEEIEYTPTPRTSLNNSLDINDIEEDLNIPFDIPADNFKL